MDIDYYQQKLNFCQSMGYSNRLENENEWIVIASYSVDSENIPHQYKYSLDFIYHIRTSMNETLMRNSMLSLSLFTLSKISSMTLGMIPPALVSPG